MLFQNLCYVFFQKKSKLRYENTTLNFCVVHNIVHLDSSYFCKSSLNNETFICLKKKFTSFLHFSWKTLKWTFFVSKQILLFFLGYAQKRHFPSFKYCAKCTSYQQFSALSLFFIFTVFFSIPFSMCFLLFFFGV